MINKVEIFAKTNQYETKRHFAAKLADAFRRAGIETVFSDMAMGEVPAFWDKAKGEPPGFSCSFNRMSRMEDGKFYWEKSPCPYVSFLVDPVVYSMETVTTPKSFATCVDRFDLDYIHSLGMHNILFMPHAVEAVSQFENDEKIFPVVFIGSCYDPDNLKAFWQKNLTADDKEVIEESIDISFANQNVPFYQAVHHTLAEKKRQADHTLFTKLCYYVDHYMRGIDRIELIRSIKDVEVHIFGGTCWRPEKPLAGWGHYFGGQRNVVLHPAVDYAESLEILKKSRISLNSVPSFRNGSHERVLASYAYGALPISSDSLYWREEFAEMPLYSFGDRAVVSEIIKDYLSDEPKRSAAVSRGREIVMAKHTWDNRAAMLLKEVPLLLE